MRCFVLAVVFAVFITPLCQSAWSQSKRKIDRIIMDGGGFYLDAREKNRVYDGGNGFSFVRIESASALYTLRCPAGKMIRVLSVNSNPVHVGCVSVAAEPIA